MAEEKIDLRGVWQFRLDAEKAGVEAGYYQQDYEDTITLPTTTAEAKKGRKSDAKETGYLTEPYHFEGYAWYRKELTLSDKQLASIATLKLERTRISYVWIDDNYVGRRDSFACAHVYDLTKYLTKHQHRLTVMVSNVDYATPGGHMTSPDTQTNWNGILGEISIAFAPVAVIENLTVYASAEKRSLDIHFTTKCCTKGAGEIKKQKKEPQTLRIICSRENGEAENTPLVAYETEIIPGEKNTHHYHLEIPEQAAIALWNEYTPNLYRVTLTLGESSVATTIGFRDLHTKERTFYLNDLPIMLRGKHDGLIFPLTGYAPMDKEAWRKVFATAKEYGVNHYRFHTCCPPEAAFAAADAMGIYLSPELPFWGTVAGEEETDAEREGRSYLLEEGFRILREFGNHPSFLIFSLGNELWGSKQVLNEILGQYKAVDKRHWYVQGSNNFQWFPEILENDDFFCGVRFTKERRFRGSYAMCDAPQGHVQVLEPENCYCYDEAICPTGMRDATEVAGEVEIQYQTGVRKVKAEFSEEVIPHVPVVSHEIGQYEVYPNYQEITKYTGVLQPENLKVFRQRLEEKGMLPMADAFFRASGHLAVECYKRELETAFRSKELSGFQLLDLQDFTGQGTALVGILDAFLENKGLVSPGEWREFCNDRVILLTFPTYIYPAGGSFRYGVELCNMRPGKEQPIEIMVQLTDRSSGELLAEERLPEMLEFTRLKHCGNGCLALPAVEEPKELTVTVIGRSETEELCRNHYGIYLYPAIGEVEAPEGIVVTDKKEEMLDALAAGEKVVFFGDSLREEVSVPGTYCTDFWCYPMFASISESMGKPLPVGTMGLCMESRHPALAQFPNEGCTTPQWWKIVTDTKLAILDDQKLTPVVSMIDNFGRNHKLGLIYEASVGKGKLLVCQANLQKQDSLEAGWLYRSLLSYAASEKFAPTAMIEAGWLKKVY